MSEPKKTNTEQLHLRLHPTLVRRLRTAAARQGMRKGELARQAIDAHIRAIEAEAQTLSDVDMARAQHVRMAVAKALHGHSTTTYPERRPDVGEIENAVRECTRLGLDDVVTLIEADEAGFGVTTFEVNAALEENPMTEVEAAKQRLMALFDPI